MTDLKDNKKRQNPCRTLPVKNLERHIAAEVKQMGTGNTNLSPCFYLILPFWKLDMLCLLHLRDSFFKTVHVIGVGMKQCLMTVQNFV